MQIVPGGNELLKPADLLKRAGVQYRMTIGDLGCGGAGFFALQAAELVGDDGSVFAVDILKSALTSVASKAKQAGLANIKTVWSNIEIFGATKIPIESLDVALLINVLFQSKKHKEMLQEAVRMLKRGGKLLVIDWKTAGSPLGPPTENRVPPQSVRQIARELNLLELDAFEAGQYHFGLLFAKR